MILYIEYAVCREHANAMTLCIRNLNIFEYLFSGTFPKQWPNINQKQLFSFYWNIFMFLVFI